MCSRITCLFDELKEWSTENILISNRFLVCWSNWSHKKLKNTNIESCTYNKVNRGAVKRQLRQKMLNWILKEKFGYKMEFVLVNKLVSKREVFFNQNIVQIHSRRTSMEGFKVYKNYLERAQKQSLTVFINGMWKKFKVFRIYRKEGLSEKEPKLRSHLPQVNKNSKFFSRMNNKELEEALLWVLFALLWLDFYLL